MGGRDTAGSSTDEGRRKRFGRFGRTRTRVEPSRSGWADTRYTIDRSTASAALNELADLAGNASAVRVRPEPDDDRTIVLPETPLHDPRVDRALRPVPAITPDTRADTSKVLPPREAGAPRRTRVVRPARARRAYGPDGVPADAPDDGRDEGPERGRLEHVDDRTAAWFAALVPSETLGEDTRVVEVRDGSGRTMEEQPTVETLANMLLDLAPQTEAEGFKGLHIVLESDGRRMELNIQ